MNTIDERGRASAAALRREMTSGFDVEAGLDDLLRSDVPLRSFEPEAPRRGWMLVAAAIAVIAVGAAGVLALRDDSPVSDTPATTATVPTSPPTTSPSDTTAAPDDVTETTLGPDTSSAVTPSTAAPVDRTVVVTDVVSFVEPQRTVLFGAGFGSGPGELSIEDCQECDPARPWAPVRIPHGPRDKVLIADTVNRRWMLLEPEDPDIASSPWSASEIPWPDGIAVTSQPVVDDTGTVYAVMFGALGSGGTAASELWVFETDGSLVEPVSRHPVASFPGAPIVLTSEGVSVGGIVIDGLVPTIDARPLLTIDTENAVRSSGAGTTTTFRYGTVDHPSLFGPMPGLADGTGLVLLLEGGAWFVDRLGVDGSVTRLALPPVASVLGAAWADASGFLQIELSADGSSYEIARYALPGA